MDRWIKDLRMSPRPLRAFRPVLHRYLGFDQGAFCLALALMAHWQGSLALSLLASTIGITGLAVGTLRAHPTAMRRSRTLVVDARDTTHSSIAP